MKFSILRLLILITWVASGCFVYECTMDMDTVFQVNDQVDFLFAVLMSFLIPPLAIMSLILAWQMIGFAEAYLRKHLGW